MHVIMLFKSHQMYFLPNTDLINIYFKIDKIFFCKYIELSSKTMFDLNKRKLLSHYGGVSVMISKSIKARNLKLEDDE